MTAVIYYQFFQHARLLGEGSVVAPFTVGRQTDAENSPPVSVLDLPQNTRQYISNECIGRKLVIVPISNRSVPRLSLKIDLDDSGNISARNLHRAVELRLRSDELLRPNEQTLLGTSGSICFPDQYELCLMRNEPSSSEYRDQPTTPAFKQKTNSRAEAQAHPQAAYSTGTPPNVRLPELADGSDSSHYLFSESVGDSADLSSTRLLSMMGGNRAVNHQEIAIRLVRTALEAFKEPPGSKEFFAAAGRAAIQMIDLDRVAVLLRRGDAWECRALSFRSGLDQSRAAAREFSQTLLKRMAASGQTTCVDPNFEDQSMWRSITEIDRAVASPIFGNNKEIVGALYGDRLIGESENNQPIGELEAALLEVLASGISSSLAIKQEQRLRSSMAQFFSPVVLDQLRADRTLLDGRVADVSVLFCDIRGFSSVSEKLSPAQTIAWINDVLTTLSECVLAHDGVLVDYIGDELMAMWGAPGKQADHAQRACRAALDMLAQIEPLGAKWNHILPTRFGLGIGINSGPASVGNTGSTKKFKYGPIGNTVNVASRVQGVTKQIGVPGLITGETAQLAKSSAHFQTRRLAKVRAVGIDKPIDLHQLGGRETAPDLCRRYEEALDAYEANNLKLAAGRLAAMVQDYPDDGPTIILLSRTVEMLTQPDRKFDPVWSLTQK